jgi:hypothetical protein
MLGVLRLSAWRCCTCDAAGRAPVPELMSCNWLLACRVYFAMPCMPCCLLKCCAVCAVLLVSEQLLQWLWCCLAEHGAQVATLPCMQQSDPLRCRASLRSY